MAEHHFYPVPAGTRPSQCNGSTCRATIYWIRTARGSAMPIDCDVEGGETPSEAKDHKQRDLFAGSVDVHDGRGVSHHATCPDAEEFRQRREHTASWGRRRS